ncbi:aprataxin and PNK-like factor [Syngnathus scovelli]|uniref:aprataxin and PNK-like factor n=1 Tax=Syngnathus scovelli TaxID=161590 RepID=UPI0021104BD8|nr:aprataxin and PNK-like factor [Syngnathus scovelli]XP_049575622.1 aprataxin and PNK-like factor [Syngnathus scovelli]
MSGFELVPMDGGDAIQLPPGETVLGRGPLLRVSDKRVSRQHGLLDNRDGRLRLKPTHSNPCFLQASPDERPRPLPRDAWCPLRRGDIFSLLPGQLMFRVAAAAADGPLGPSAACEHGGEMAPAVLPGPREKRRLPLWMTARVGTSPGRQASKESRRGEETTKVKRRRNEGARADEWTQTTTVTERVDVACRQAICSAQDMPSSKRNVTSGRSCHVTASAGQAGSKGNKKDQAASQRRAACPYGKDCYRKNPLHLRERSHPGDSDYEEPEENERPECPYGTDCYRENPLHRKQYKHTKRAGPPAAAAAHVDSDWDSHDSLIDNSEDGHSDSDYVPPPDSD